MTAAFVFLAGIWMIYAFGAGYLGHLSLPTPFNVLVSLLLVAVLIAAVRAALPRRAHEEDGGQRREVRA